MTQTPAISGLARKSDETDQKVTKLKSFRHCLSLTLLRDTAIVTKMTPFLQHVFSTFLICTKKGLKKYPNFRHFLQKIPREPISASFAEWRKVTKNITSDENEEMIPVVRHGHI